MTEFATKADLALLDSWNSHAAAYPEDKCLQDLFWEQAAKTPNSLALVDGDKSLTYEELNLLTDRLASLLFHKHNVRPDTVVAIFMERSAEYVIAYLSILKAGGAYMPVELVYPHGMIGRAIEETDCLVILTKNIHKNRLPTGVATEELDNLASLVSFKHKDAVLPTMLPGGFEPRSNPDSLAFIVMSSGTTGTPKGICQVHRSAVHSYHDRFTRYPYHVDETTGQVSDRVGAGVFFVWECFRPLLRGATCVVIPDDVLFDPEAVSMFLQNQKITRVLFTPSLLQLITDTLSAEDITARLGHMRMVWLCGEVVTVDLATYFGNLTPKTQLFNLYSISECHDATIGNLKTELDITQKYATCGKNICNVTLYIVEFEDEARTIMRRLPIGMPGEVYVGGPVLARGYLKMPEKTAERFVKNPFGEGKLYRTGDMGRILKNGQLEIVGRCDFMVKVRGYSVVLGAVETALAKHPRLSSAVVLALGDEGTDKKLVAWVVPKTWGQPPSAASVRDFLKDHLPPYAIPGTFCVISALPVNQSAAGKLDRKKLPDPEQTPRLQAFSIGDDVEFQRKVPTNETEKSLLTLFSELLSTPEDEISVDDNFFDVGGHSLLATRLTSKINTSFFSTVDSSTFKLKDIMDGPTIKKISIRILYHLNVAEGGEEKNSTGDGGSSGTSHDGNNNDDDVIDLLAEANMFDPSVYPAATRKSQSLSRYHHEMMLLKPRRIFLTGATGWLGSHILHSLLSTTVVEVVCLVRAESTEAAAARLRSIMARYDLALDDDMLDARVFAVVGSLNNPLLGMDDVLFKEVASTIDCIIHCGADVNLIKPYSVLKQSNVYGTQEILRLATTNGLLTTKVKPVHYISTNGVFPIDRKAYFAENDQTSSSSSSIVVEEEHESVKQMANKHLKEGYARSKFVAETMCHIARTERGSPVSIMRPGNMAGSSTTGRQNLSDFVYLFLASCIDLKMAPTNCAYSFDLTPVDFAAKVVTHAVVTNPSSVMGRTIHLQNPNKPVTIMFVVEKLRAIGHTLVDVERKEFLDHLEMRCDAERKEGIRTSVLLQLESGYTAFETYFKASTWMTYGTAAMEQVLTGSNITCPIVDENLLRKWFPLT